MGILFTKHKSERKVNTCVVMTMAAMANSQLIKQLANLHIYVQLLNRFKPNISFTSTMETLILYRSD